MMYFVMIEANITYSFEIEYVRDRMHELQITILSQLVAFLWCLEFNKSRIICEFKYKYLNIYLLLFSD